MKNGILLTIIALITAATVSAQSGYGFGDGLGSQPAKAVVEWKKDHHDFGEVPQGTPVVYEFEFKNESLKPVVISNVKASCHCTTPDWPKQPVKPGETAVIKATYDAKAVGKKNKKITVWMNDSKGEHFLYLKGKVVKPGDVTRER